MSLRSKCTAARFAVTVLTAAFFGQVKAACCSCMIDTRRLTGQTLYVDGGVNIMG